ncbi:translocation/assembly module TamB domain-containing protein [Lutimaribacter sp. EGI FJ00015]|uniref:Translocation/assembly module TamB domain-containing protein n=1 Tax=Lutimaribacter degradans TaxID=2945989 RepID=A0ACC5ZUG6_9RHOB|nr:translocation/assembly module TamB domain-containing protein [Lutimaribacter sp. EGI FJ00013]MCM2561717.1 translocation/assembly module TamB domain-containing protein [Lutimaribacter sp. EGI FJ00013]MCO0612570.1 translocation/assembly module TamB domain-containing protein [Lutimaribacter sp. EGI FJ00015]MCO0635229.1 translocation/assembly module TamB domain-containing protein [Lutimaribacter sp. EGI FJ00014]
MGTRLILRALAVLVLAVMPALVWAQDQQARDRGVIQAFLEDNLSAAGREVRIEGFSGALSGRASIETLTIADAQGVWITLRGAVLDWNRAALLSGRLEVAELSAEAVIVARAPETGPDAPATPTAREPFALPELPVSIDIGQLALERVELGAPLLGREAAFEVQGNAELASGAGAAELRLTRLDGPQGALEMTGSYSNETRELGLSVSLQEDADGIAANLLDLPGRPALALSIAGDDPIDDFRADIQLATDGVARLTGAVTLANTPGTDGNARRVTANLSGDIAPVFAPEYRRFFGPEIALRASAVQRPDGRQVLEQLRLTAQSIEITGSGAIGADGWPERLNLSGRVADPEGNPVNLPTGGDGTQVDGADLQLEYDRAAGDGWQMQATARQVVQAGNRLGALRLTAGGTITPPRGDGLGTIVGDVALAADGLTLADAKLAQAVGPSLSGRLGFEWTDANGLRLAGIDLSGADYGLTGDASLRLPEDMFDPQATLDLRLAARDLARFAALADAPLGGSAALDISGDVALYTSALDLLFDGQTTDLSVGQPQLDPLLAGAGTLSLRLLRDSAATSVQGLRIATDHARITGEASLGEEAGSFDMQAEVADTARIAPGLSGPARLAAQGTGAVTAWTVNAQATLPGNGNATWQGRVTGLPDAPRLAGRAEAQLDDLAPYSGLAGRQLGGGLSASAEIDAGLTDLDGRIDLSATLQNLSVDVETADQLLRGNGELSAVLRRDAQGRLNVDSLRLSTPALTATANGEMTADSQSLAAELRLPDGGILAQELAGPVTVQGNAKRGTGDWQIDVTGGATGDTRLAANGTIAPDFTRADLALTGRTPLALANARLRPRAVSGIASYDLRLAGPLALSSLSGNIATRDARLTLPSLGLALGEIDASADLSGGQARIAATAVVSSGGRVQLEGGVGLTPPFNADLSVIIEQVVLRQARLYETTATGRVTLQGPLTNGARIGGLIDLGPAELRIPASTGPSFGDLAGLRHVNEPPAVRQVRQWAGLIAEPGAGNAASGPAYPIDLTIRAPSRIFVRGRGLDAELGGQLQLLGTTDNIVPQGRFELVRGRLDILGQRLALDEGVLQLQGSFDPIIRFAATTRSQDVVITLGIEGSASAPDLVVQSSPELPQDEILSLLLFGRDVTEISALQALRLANAVRVLSGHGGAGLTGQLRETLSLDDFDVSTDDSGNVQARAGKYLSENIYSDVVVNGEGETDINLNLEVSPNITVRGRLGSDGDTGLGVYYERDY